jgi:hypothetical protein
LLHLSPRGNVYLCIQYGLCVSVHVCACVYTFMYLSI